MGNSLLESFLATARAAREESEDNLRSAFTRYTEAREAELQLAKDLGAPVLHSRINREFADRFFGAGGDAKKGAPKMPPRPLGLMRKSTDLVDRALAGLRRQGHPVDEIDRAVLEAIESLGEDGQRKNIIRYVHGQGLKPSDDQVGHRIRKYIGLGIIERIEHPVNFRLNRYRITVGGASKPDTLFEEDQVGQTQEEGGTLSDTALSGINGGDGAIAEGAPREDSNSSRAEAIRPID